MKCPFCRKRSDRVVDTRESKEGDSIRRRRECLECGSRFTTHERVEEHLPPVIKKDGRREAYRREKVISGLQRACEKRPIATEAIDAVADELERYLLEKGEKEIESTVIGEWLSNRLRQLDEVAYVRFASVYRSFRDVSEFMKELEDVIRDRHQQR